MTAPVFTPEDYAAVANLTPREAVLAAGAEILGETPTDLSKTFSDHGADSLDMMEIVIAVEDELLISLGPDALGLGVDMTVANFIALVERVRGKHSSVPA